MPTTGNTDKDFASMGEPPQGAIDVAQVALLNSRNAEMRRRAKKIMGSNKKGQAPLGKWINQQKAEKISRKRALQGGEQAARICS